MANISKNNTLAHIESMEDLKNVALSMTGTIMMESVLCPNDYPHTLAFEPNDSYCSNNGTVAFISDGIYYVVPATQKVFEILRANYFREAYFCVICSNLDQPVNSVLKSQWHQLLAWRREVRSQEFIESCEAFCDKNHIGSIPQETLDTYCMAMPTEGIQVKYIFQEQPSRHYPSIRSDFLDSVAITKLGKYCYNNGTLVFVYRDGKTYVTRAYWLIRELQEAGFREGGLFVPFSNSETILDDEYHQKWEKIKIVCSE